MPITDIVIVSLIIFAFLTFAVALAWGDYQTRDIAKASRVRALADARVVPSELKRAEGPARKVEEKKPQRVPVHAAA